MAIYRTIPDAEKTEKERRKEDFLDTKGHTAEKSLASVCAQTLKICRVPFWGGESAPLSGKGQR